MISPLKGILSTILCFVMCNKVMLNEPKTVDIKQPSRILLKFLLFGTVCIAFRKHSEGIQKLSISSSNRRESY